MTEPRCLIGDVIAAIGFRLISGPRRIVSGVYFEAARMRLRGTSADGTNRTNPADLMMSVARGNPEVAVRGRQDRF